jgi:hypothetical protein
MLKFLLVFSSVSDVKKYFKPVTLHFAKRWFFVPTTYVIPPEGYLVISVSLPSSAWIEK